jgi:hypothetical protein
LHERIDEDSGQLREVYLGVGVTAEGKLHQGLEHRPNQVGIGDRTADLAQKDPPATPDPALHEQPREQEEQGHVERINPRIDGTECRSVLDDLTGTETTKGMAQNDEEDTDAACIVDPGDAGALLGHHDVGLLTNLWLSLSGPRQNAEPSWIFISNRWPRRKSAGGRTPGQGSRPGSDDLSRLQSNASSAYKGATGTRALN